MSRVTSYEVRRARHVFCTHEDASCAACGKQTTGTFQATAQPYGKGSWAMECSDCGVVTWYDVDQKGEES